MYKCPGNQGTFIIQSITDIIDKNCLGVHNFSPELKPKYVRIPKVEDEQKESLELLVPVTTVTTSKSFPPFS